MVTGFSQGASAALGLARALQEGADRYFQLKAVAPISGAYTPQEMLEGTPDNLSGLLTRRAVKMLEHPTGRLAEAMRVDFGVCTDWTPRVRSGSTWLAMTSRRSSPTAPAAKPR